MKTEDVGQDTFGCQYCAGVGYEDYPQCFKPCRIPGHKERHEKNVSAIVTYMKNNPEPEPLKKPSGNWGWTGHGWKNLDYRRCQ